MEMNEYQKEASQYASPNATPYEPLLGLVGEAGEVAEVVKRIERGDYSEMDPVEAKTLIRQKLIKELGDVLWYLSRVSEVWAGVTLDEVAQGNLDKLKSRAQKGNIMGEGSSR